MCDKNVYDIYRSCLFLLSTTNSIDNIKFINRHVRGRRLLYYFLLIFIVHWKTKLGQKYS